MKNLKNILSLLLALMMVLSVAAFAEESYYPVTVSTYDYEGNVIETTYEKAPEKVICVYQGTIETMIALGLEDHVIASYGLDNPVKEDWEEGLSKMNYNEEVFAPDKETVTMLEPDLIFSWGSLFSKKNLGDMYASTVRSIDGIRTFAAGMYPDLY